MISHKKVMIITDRANYEEYLSFLHDNGVSCILSNFCKGTAHDNVLEMLGMERTDKVMIDAFITPDKEDAIKRGLRRDMNIGGKGAGIAVFLPIDSVGGKSGESELFGEFENNEGRESMENKEQTKYSLIVAIINKGYTEAVMETARSAGARGGTMVKAKGTGASVFKFLGVSITEEKEMVYIVSPREEKNDIMRAIMENHGVKSDAHGIIYSMPVDSVEGIFS